MNKNIDP